MPPELQKKEAKYTIRKYLSISIKSKKCIERYLPINLGVLKATRGPQELTN